MKERSYLCIDLKSFYASVECRERDLDPMTTHLVVADESRTTKTICLAVSPSLKNYGIPGRPRLFEVVRQVEQINQERRRRAPNHQFTGSSFDEEELKKCPERELTYVTAPPRMALYMEYSTRIYEVYLKYVSPEDMHVYSIDEVFLDVTNYLDTYRLSARELAGKIIEDVLLTTGITAAAGIGTNLYLCKVAMDIVAKHVQPDENGVRMAELDERSYRRLLWNHRPLTDFWRVGRGYAGKLEENGLFTMGDVARCSLGKETDYYNEDLLYKLFGVNAELLIDHAWGWEPCTMADIKAYRPQSNSVGSGQVLHCPYDYGKAKLVVREMADMLALELVDKRLVTDQMVLTVGYDRENLEDESRRDSYKGDVTTDRYGRRVPKHAHGTIHLDGPTSSAKRIMEAVMELYERIVNPKLLVRRVAIAANHVVDEDSVKKEEQYEQLSLFTDYDVREEEKKQEETRLLRERRMQQAMLDIKKKYGKNAILKGMNLEEGATAMERNNQIGGHRAYGEEEEG